MNALHVSKTSLSRSFALFAIALTSAACSGGPDAADDSSNDELRRKTSNVCATHHAGQTADGDAVEICDALFTSVAAVRPPADQTDAQGIATIYAGMDGPGGVFVDRDGVRYAPLSARGNPLTDKRGWSSYPAMRMPDNRNLFLVYKIVGKVAPSTDARGEAIMGITLQTAAPAILIAGKAIDGLALGTWEGTTPALTPTGAFDPTSQLPIRITFTAMTDAGQLHAFGEGRHALEDGALNRIEGTIENFAQGVTATSGECYPALTASGASNPFKGASDGAVDLLRVAGMHSDGDQVIVMTMPKGSSSWSPTSMGNVGPFQPATLIQAHSKLSLHLFPHGRPMGNDIQIHKVAATTNGGGGC